MAIALGIAFTTLVVRLLPHYLFAVAGGFAATPVSVQLMLLNGVLGEKFAPARGSVRLSNTPTATTIRKTLIRRHLTGAAGVTQVTDSDTGTPTGWRSAASGPAIKLTPSGVSFLGRVGVADLLHRCQPAAGPGSNVT